MRSRLDAAEATIRTHADKFGKSMTRFDGKTMTKLELLNFPGAHEMYHRGQFTVYERLLGIKPALTTRFEKRFAQSRAQAAD
jgi:uncharacterized damage-inducible protein DinB